ncbi:hypothetical protein PITCH_A1620002 [uncultured Desulfobacterium sp.]|uniref:Uncharacterized protein n=1 Tax=uncultured Desulfobacterium sp. TaxID=201089 RepID=A0A445MU18_9BACT|nr:hypothetical protein PITCH_A1620002 [uncultured Desulfobacterium sp.]
MEINKKSERTIRGVLIPVNRRKNDDVIEVAIETIDGEIYLVSQNGKGEKFRGLTHHNVLATGSVSITKHGDFVIKVKKYTLLSADDDFEQYV